MKPLVIKARPHGADETYLPLHKVGLTAAASIISGDGSAESPWVHQVTISAKKTFAGVIRIALPVFARTSRFFLPGFMYGTNRGETARKVDRPCPCLRQSSEFPASPWWMTRSDRLSHPVAFAYTSHRIEGLAAAPYFVQQENRMQPWESGITGEFSQFAGFGCSLTPAEVWYTLGYEYAPWLFQNPYQWTSRAPLENNCFHLASGSSITVYLYQFNLLAQDERALHEALQWVYWSFQQAPRHACSARETVAAIADAIRQDGWMPEQYSYAGIVFSKVNGKNDQVPLSSIAWTNGMTVAWPMLQASACLGDQAMRNQAIDCINHIASHAVNPRSGLPWAVCDHGMWSNNGWWSDCQHTPGHPAYLAGQCVYFMLKAYAFERQCGANHPAWFDFAKIAVACFLKAPNSDGEYPYVFSAKTGTGLEYDSFSGCWCLAAAALLMEITGNTRTLPALIASAHHYHTAYIIHQECYGGALNHDKAIDSEGVLAYIRAIVHLHHLTSQDFLLDYLRDALYYAFSFTYCYNIPTQTPTWCTPGQSSCGGSIASVANPYIHPWPSSIMDEMYYYLSLREDAYIRSRLEDVRLWSCQCHAFGDSGHSGSKHGWLPEQFCHALGLPMKRRASASSPKARLALIPWAGSAILEGLTGVMWGME